jgi:hypothetical protein
MRTLVMTGMAVFLAGVVVARAQQVAPTAAGQATPPGTIAPGSTAPGAAAPAAPSAARVFTASAGLIFNAVRQDRVVDFEMVMGYPTVRAQARGWRVFKAAEPGPNATVLYVFLIDPTVSGAEYGLGRILSDAYPDQVQDIWKLYTGALAGGGSLLNLAPVQPPPLPVR